MKFEEHPLVFEMTGNFEYFGEICRLSSQFKAVLLDI